MQGHHCKNCTSEKLHVQVYVWTPLLDERKDACTSVEVDTSAGRVKSCMYKCTGGHLCWTREKMQHTEHVELSDMVTNSKIKICRQTTANYELSTET